ncbi:telomere-associated protein Tap [Streptomyces tirandamycinicus]|uniref:Transcriptional regulator n=1 Tax=Streptomyces tirandamycinicus TaxID=2174846 RepID=A0A2S1T287_9ACTN|nr:helix-turn-helix domain-containing protein [Streptomyces tirandamycinicus]AWI32748.1 transcriptional regulator [Streptomyces tirandamycinicus]
MPSEEDALFGAVDALLEEVASREPLPAPAERKRLREAAGLSQEQVAGVLQVRREAVSGWEAGRTEPRAPKRAAYARLLEGLAARYPAPAPETRETPETPQTPGTPEAVPGDGPAAPDAAAPRPGDGQPARQQAAAPPPDSARPAAVPPPSRPAGGTAAVRSPSPRRPAEPETTTGRAPVPDASAADARFAHGPLGVLDGDGSVYCLGGLVLDCPARTLVEVVEWVLSESRLGAARLHRAGRDADPLVVLTAAAAERLGLPPVLEDRRGLRLPESHAVVKQIAKAGWKLTRRGFGPWTRVYRPAEGDRRRCVQFAVLPWDALDTRSWGGTGLLPAPEVAAVLGTYASRVITPRGSTAVCGLELMTALRPPTRAVRDETSGAWMPGPVPGSLSEAVDPAPPEAPAEHPIVAGLYPRHHQRTPDQVLDEEAFDWIREPELLTGAECARRFAVGIDVNTAFLAAANRLVVGLSAPVHVKRPAFDKRVPGSWLVDLSGIELDPRLPSPFTPHGERPDGPAWYATPTVAYAAELVATFGLPVSIEPVEAWLRRESGPYLDPWYKRLSEAYKATMADLGVVAGMDDAEFLTAMARHRQADPGTAAVLSAIKATVKGGIGKLRERPQGAGYRPGERWPALERPTWRPDIRAAVISAARVNMHRKILKTALATQQAPAPTGHLALGDDALVPIALLSDCAVYLSDGPSPPDVLPYTPDGRPAPGTFRLGVSPGMVKHEGTQDLLWAVRMLEEGHNPAQHIKGTDAAREGE